LGTNRNFFLSYDLNGSTPSHAEMDKHLRKLPCPVERVLETVWYVHTLWNEAALYTYVNSILSVNDRVLVIEATDAMMRNLLVPNQSVQKLWQLPLVLPAAPRPPAMRRPALALSGR